MKVCLLLLLGFIFLLSDEVAAQGRYFTKAGHIWFFSKAPLENIEAHNTQAVSFIDFSTGEMAFSVPMKAFKFKKSLMQTHFNENFIESDKYPKATFAGKFLRPEQVILAKEGAYKVLVEGVLNIHGVERPLQTEGLLVVKAGKVAGTATFVVAPRDYDIVIPLLVREHIAKEVTVHVDMLYQPYLTDTP